MIKKVCVCDRCKKEVSDNVYEVSVNGVTLDSAYGLPSTEVAAYNMAENLRRCAFGERSLCSKCTVELIKFMNGEKI